jgi:hypothetical protein
MQTHTPNLEVLRTLAADGRVATTPGPDGLTLFNYTDRTVWERLWCPDTLAARGLVLDEHGAIIARPWPKFFNVGEPGFAPDDLPAEVPELSDKHDGSLVIVFWNPKRERWQAVTRGSWDNPQTRFANDWLAERSPDWPREFTYLFELVAPWNRIVLIYERADMIFLGRVNNITGQDCSYAEAEAMGRGVGLTTVGWRRGPLDSVNAADQTITDAEGFVVRYSNGLRVKVKYAEYLRLHKLMTGLSVLAIWEGLSAGKDQAPEGVPDEFMAWWQQHRDAMVGAYRDIEGRAKAVFDSTPKDQPRKGIAAVFTRDKALAPVLFAMLDGKDHAPVIWKQVRPVGGKTFLAAGAA